MIKYPSTLVLLTFLTNLIVSLVLLDPIPAIILILFGTFCFANINKLIFSFADSVELSPVVPATTILSVWVLTK